MHDYDFDISDEQCQAALRAVRELFDDLSNPTLSAMPLPTIALSSATLEYDSYGTDFGREFELVIDVDRLSNGVVKSVTPLELRTLLFNQVVCEQVTEALVGAMVWIKDLELRGSNAVNEDAIAAHLRLISVAVAESLKTFPKQRTIS